MRLKNTFAKLSGVASGLLLSGLLALNGVEARLVSDDNGTSVDVPEHISRIVVTNILPLASAVTMYLGDGSRIVGMHPASMSAAKSGLLGELHPEVLQADTHFIQGANLNLESLMALKPDLVLINASDRRMLDRVRAAGLTAFGISAVKWHYDVEATYEGWMRSLKALFPDAKANSAAMAEKFRHYRTLIAERTSNLSDAQRRTVLFIVRTDARQLVVSGEKFFGEYWAKAVGAKNAAHELKAENANAVVTMESIYAWNPDIVLLTNFTPLQPNDLIEGRDAGRDWTSVKAVKDRRIYKMPLGLYRSFTPTADTPLTLLWLAKTIYPERFADIDLQAETEHFYRDVFGLSLTEAQIKTIYAPQARASVGLTGSVRSSR